jgi:hypothetical protein
MHRLQSCRVDAEVQHERAPSIALTGQIGTLPAQRCERRRRHIRNHPLCEQLPAVVEIQPPSAR